MDDLIRRNDVLDKAQWIGLPATWDNPWPEGKEAVTVEDINLIPAVDAVEVRHAYWTNKRTIEHDGELYCSSCGGAALFIDWRQEWKSSYCPWCGADMRGNEDG